MAKRILASVLWFMAIAYLWNLVALYTGLPQAPGIVLGLAAAVLYGGDPLGRIWARPAPVAPTPMAPAEPA